MIVHRCYVHEVCRDMTPASSVNLDKSSSQTFQEYFKERYGLTVTVAQQPLLRIGSADKQYEDMRQPIGRGGAAGTASSRGHRYLLPEFVQIHRVPSSLWQECQLLPFVLDHVDALLKVFRFQSSYIQCSGDFPREWSVRDYSISMQVLTNYRN